MATPSYPPPHSHPLLPGPRPSTTSLLPPSYPPAPRRWSTYNTHPVQQQAATGGYISPDSSPTEDIFPSPPNQPPILNRGYSFSNSDYFDRRGSVHPPPLPNTHHGDQGYIRENRGSFDGGHLGDDETDPFYYPAMPRSMGGGQPKKKVTRKADGKQPTFLTKLYQILEQPEYAHIIRWDDAGEVIIIEKPEELSDKILPLVYRQSRFASFSRQLNIYGFMRKVSLRHVDRGICDPDASTWSHPFLRRSSTPAEIQGFKRRVPPRPSQSIKRRASMTPSYHEDMSNSLGLSPTSSEGSYHSPPDAYQHHLLPDVEEDKAAVFPPPSIHANEQVYGSLPENTRLYPSFTMDRPVYSQNIAMPAAQNINQNNQLNNHSLFFDRSVSSGVHVPASAPAHISAFPEMPSSYESQGHQGLGSLNMRISQGHIRTRSVQGEPPSATLFSPSSPLANTGWIPSQPMSLKQEPTGGRPEDEVERENDPAFQGDNTSLPTYDLNNPSSWVRRGYTDLSTGAPIPNSMDRQSFVPSSVPNDFAPSYVSPGIPTGGSMDVVPTPSTVSPGVYQSGFAFTSVRSTYSSSQPRAVPANTNNRTERRPSLGTSLYSPRSRPGVPLSLGAIRGIGRDNLSNGAGDRGRDEMDKSGSGTVTGRGYDGGIEEGGRGVKRVEPDEALPSAGLRLHRGPFEGMLPEEDMAMHE